MVTAYKSIFLRFRNLSVIEPLCIFGGYLYFYRLVFLGENLILEI